MADLDGPRFVLTESGVVHDPSCGSVRHQVDEHERPHRDVDWEHESLGVDADGWEHVRERQVEISAGTYRARYVTVDELRSSRRKYRRCRVCAPDAPDWVAAPARPTSVVARHLRPHHVGRELEGGGVIEEIRVIVRTSGGSIEVALDEPVSLAPRERPAD